MNREKKEVKIVHKLAAGTLLFVILFLAAHKQVFINQWIALTTLYDTPLLMSEAGDTGGNGEDTYIKWIDFNLPVELMHQALNYDISAYQEETPLNWVELLAYCAAKNWGNLKGTGPSKDMDDIVTQLREGENLEELTKNLKLYSYYYEAYQAVLGGFVGEFEIEETNPANTEEKLYVKKYGLKVFSPVAKGYSYSHYRDFGNSRSYGYQRKHLGNDIMGSIGIPIIAVEDGYIEALGWNQYGGWRVGIRSIDGKRYYYYAHLRKDHPFPQGLTEGDRVQSGDVIGYLGRTGYSKNENVNNIETPHLHFGLQIIFDESQKDGTNQIWIDVYPIVEFLSKNRMEVVQDSETKDYRRAIHINNYPMD